MLKHPYSLDNATNTECVRYNFENTTAFGQKDKWTSD